MLNRMARVKGCLVWIGFGEVTHIQAAAELAEKHFAVYKSDEIEIDVRCSSDAPDTKPYCFKMRRRFIWDCLNPRQGADDPKPVELHDEMHEAVLASHGGLKKWKGDGAPVSIFHACSFEIETSLNKEWVRKKLKDDEPKDDGAMASFRKWLDANSYELVKGFQALRAVWQGSAKNHTVEFDEWARLIHKSQHCFRFKAVSQWAEHFVGLATIAGKGDLAGWLRVMQAKTPSSLGSCVPHAKFEAKQATSDPIGKSPVEAASKWFWTYEEMKEMFTPHCLPESAVKQDPVEPVKSDARKISYGFEKLHDMWLEKTKCQPEHGCFQEFVSLLCILSEIEKEKDWIDVVIRVAGNYVRKLTESSIPHPPKSLSMLEWLKSQQRNAKMEKVEIRPYKPDGGWNRDPLVDFVTKVKLHTDKPSADSIQKAVEPVSNAQQEAVDRILNERRNMWLGANGPGAAKVQVALPPKVPLRSKRDYAGELKFEVFVVDLTSETLKQLENRLRRKTQVAG